MLHSGASPPVTDKAQRGQRFSLGKHLKPKKASWLSNTSWARDNGNGHFLSSLENTILSHFQSKTLKNS